MTTKLLSTDREPVTSFSLEPLETRTFLSLTPAVMAPPQMSADAPRPQFRITSASISFSRESITQMQPRTVSYGGGFASPSVRIAPVRTSIVFISIERISIPRSDFDAPHIVDGQHVWPHQNQWPAPKMAPVVMPPTGAEVPTVTDDPAPARSARALRLPLAQAAQSTSAQVSMPTVHSENLPLATAATRLVQEVQASVITLPQAALAKAPATVAQLHSALLSTMMAHNIAWRGDTLIAPAASDVQTPALKAPAPSFTAKLASAIKAAKRFDFATLGDPLTLLTDPIAAFVDESITLGKSVASIGVQSTGAWSVTAAVIAADVVLLTYLYRRDHRNRQRRKLQPAWSVRPQVFTD